MKIWNVRLGLATNSSSSHSLLIMPGLSDSGVIPGVYGWDSFTIGTKEGKKRYLATALYLSVRDLAGNDIAKTVAKAWAGAEVDDDDYIDHQSRWDFPLEFGGKHINKQFFMEFKKYLLQKDVAILGGNDNGEGHPMAGDQSFNLPICETSHHVARKDEKYGYWTLFGGYNGAKIRLSLEDPSKAVEPTKAYSPELVDVKITDFCPFNCAFCYQGSTAAGKHADMSTLQSLVYVLQGMKVFEVAIGGGEPTLHPNFLDFCRQLREVGCTPNFTTKSLAWLRDASVWKPLMDVCGAFAYSASSASDIKKLAALLEANNISAAKASIQLVMGTFSMYQFSEMLEAAANSGFRVTLLGYKTTNRGGEFKPEDYRGWLQELMTLRARQEALGYRPRILPQICIDTALAEQYEKEIVATGFPRWMFHTKEGKFSMYIDAVNELVGPSSYHEILSKSDLSQKSLLQSFDRW